MLMTEKEKEYGQQRAVPVRPDGNAPLAALRGGIDRQSAVAALQLRGHLQSGLCALPSGLPLLVRQERDPPAGPA